MKIAIITEGGKNTGFGHITRCLGLSSAFEKKGCRVFFVIMGDASAKKALRGKAFRTYRDTNKMIALIKDCDCVIVDSYKLHGSAYSKIRRNVKLLVSIDDNKRVAYPPGIVINGSIYAKELRYPASMGVTYLLGPEFLPMRQAFAAIENRETRKDIKNILILFGGSDFRNMSGKIEVFISRLYPEASVNIVKGNRLNAGGLIRLMQQADIAISAGGQTLYELARTGTPAIGICVADNQLNNLKGWSNAGFIKYCGWYDDRDLLNNLKSALIEIEGWKIRKEMSSIGRILVDGKGAERVVEKIFGEIK